MHIDKALAREFDRPQEGFAVQGSASQGNVKSFMEAETTEYIQPLKLQGKMRSASDSITMAAAISKKITSHGSLERPLSPRLEYSQIRKCLARGDTESALAWFEQAPPSAFSDGQQQYRQQAKIVKALQARVLTDYTKDIHILSDFALLSARKGFAPSLGHALVAHISRFSNYEQLEPFWSSYTAEAKQAAFYLSSSEKKRVEQVLESTANIMIRALCLAPRYIDTLRLLKDIRVSPQVPSTSSGENRRPSIEAFTYKLLLEEMSRSRADPSLLEEIANLARHDWSLPTASFNSTSLSHQPSSSSARPSPLSMFPLDQPGNEDYHSTIAQNLRSLLPSTITANTTSSSSYRTSLESSNPSEAARTLQSHTDHTKPKAAYTYLSSLILKGIRPSSSGLSGFSRLCTEHGAEHLVKALTRKLAIPEAEFTHNRLKSKMREGHMPSSDELRVFIESCRHGRCLSLAKSLGDWMEGQGGRFKSLWVVARMHRLVKLGKSSSARRALHLFGETFVMVGIPRQITALVQSRHHWTAVQPTDRPGVEVAVRPNGEYAILESANPQAEQPKIWPSSHGITIALKALFVLRPDSVEYIQSVYASFVKASYSTTTLPLSMSPDPHSYDAFILPLVRLGIPGLALQILYDMLDRGLMPTQHNWDVVIGGFAKKGDVKMVEGIFNRRDQHDHAAGEELRFERGSNLETSKKIITDKKQRQELKR